MKRTELNRATRLKRRRQISRRKRREKGMPLESWEQKALARDEFRAAARAQACCQVTGAAGRFDAHHVVEHSWLKRNAADHEWDPRNALRITRRVHERHTNAFERIPLRCLTNENIEFAFEVQGAYAYDYLTRCYAGTDDRVELAYTLRLEIEHATA